MMGEMEIPDELVDQLLGEYQGPEQLTGPDGLINRLRRRLIERAAGAELERHLGYPPGALRAFCAHIGVAKVNGTHEVELLESFVDVR